MKIQILTYDKVCSGLNFHPASTSNGSLPWAVRLGGSKQAIQMTTSLPGRIRAIYGGVLKKIATF
jgi:hypothetical protein